ncbi:HEAT repeat domain-containing protein [Polyangium fumosum]|uniref:Tetratricopeptide repeat protein n=1 Tax=Polyangium fumosum TaxID=889272 RepID=A0A4V5PLY1_9BACT|nr:HEAT repeat domain-containing protein [Polyangium fumosum]TKD01055.1 tetratricopeptide repeat protein [Polyangium fumosum]
MRSHVLAGCLLLGLPFAATVLAPPSAEAADFDPSGRNRKKPPKPNPQPGGGSRPAQPKQPKQPQGDADATGKGPGSDALIARYTAIVISQPSAPFPLQRLSQLYRERDGNIKKLVEEFEKRAATPGTDAWAAKVALAGIYKLDGRPEDAVKTYEAAIAEKPNDPQAILALAQLQSERGDKSASRASYEKALALLKPGPDFEQTTRTLLGLCLDLKDFEAAKKHHDALVKAAQGSLFVKAELGRELLARSLYDRAEVEFRELVKAAAGDNRALAPALRDLGQVLARQKKTEEALSVLKRALTVAGGAAGVRAEILVIMTDAFRAEGKLAELIPILEAEKAQDAQRLATLGGLYEETGDVDKAIATYRKVLGIDSRAIDVRLKLVHLLQTAGELDAAIKEYEALIKAAPGNPDFVFELCETLIQRGDRPKALKLLTELEARVGSEPEILAAVADFYERVEEKDKALKVLQKLAASGGADHTYIVDLGDRYYQAGDKKKALETWARIKQVVPNRARANSLLGEVYLDHDMPLEALNALREAVQLEPTNVRYKKNLAVAIERTAATLGSAAQRYAEARVIWEELLAGSQNDKLLAREARTHIVSLWSLAHELPSRVAPLTARFNGTPPDLEAGRLLAEVQRRLHRLADAEATLRKVTELAPGDEESLLALERILVLEQNLLGAIGVLEKLVEVNPKRAREFYQRMAQYAAELYRDDDSIKYAARAVELSPEDANGHQKLGDMYRRRQDFPHAIAEYRQAIQRNDRLFPVYFDLAELLLSSGQVDEADRLFRRVVRSSPDEELVSRAARMSMQINLGKNSLESLERELLPVAVGNPQKGIYRRLLVELYGAMTLPLVQKVRHEGGTSPAARAARAELGKIGARAIKPLLDALADDKESQQKIAIEVLAYVENKSAGPALYNYATGQADKSLRVRAMIACGALRDPSILPRYEQMLAPKDTGAALLPSDSIAVAAAWGVARMGDKKAEPLLVKLLGSTSPEVRGVAALGLGLTHDKKYTTALVALARAPEAGATARAAAVHALAELGTSQSDNLHMLVALADTNEPVLRQAALVALARLAPKGDAAQSASAENALASSLFATDESMRRTAVAAATALATKNFSRTGEALPVPDGPLSMKEILAGLGPDAARVAGARARALVALAPSLERAAVAAASTSPDRARVVADALLANDVELSLAPLLGPDDKLDPESARATSAAIERIAAAVVPAFVALVRHPALEVRTRAVELLARRPEKEAQDAVIDALSDPEESVRRAALAALGRVKHPATISAVARLGREAPSWPLRVRAAEALGRLGAGATGRVAFETLTTIAQEDPYALVREAAALSMASLDRAAAEPILRKLSASDPEPRIRKTAADLLAGKTTN